MNEKQGEKPIYLDGFSTLPLAPAARDAMLAVWEQPGNAGSPNGSGERAARIIADGRAAVADLIGAAPGEITFTSGATEANNLVMMGAARAIRRSEPVRRRILISAIEHKAVIEPARELKGEGFIVETVPVTSSGVVDLDALHRMAKDDLAFASIMFVNNELGTVQPIRGACEIVHAVGGRMHSDAAQAFGKVPLDVADLDIDYLSLSSHKSYGPMGIGALYVAAGTPRPNAQLFGGGQQSGLRPGTEPVALIAGFGAAALVAKTALADGSAHGSEVLAVLLDELRKNQVRFLIPSNQAPRVPGGVALLLPGTDGDALCARLASKVSISTGSACTSGQIRTSHVLESIGISDQEARSVIRIFCNNYNTVDEIRLAARLIADAVQRCTLATGGHHQ
ncbi:cysteine desulfurase family protein [Paracoccus versutus]|uniref:cysteine desulfurase family protein n=1 Tax=Paracoccus versutus TaxID=34007 RepID=UPI000DF84BE8|nr:cysteine desulfurase family protein [Paracoccus versutus]RDD72742.1 cysteine desulfurase [Paracoccus versutus]